MVAWLSLLCAQFAALPAIDTPSSQPSIVAAPAQVVIARPQGSFALVKAENSSSQAKHQPGLDLLPFASSALFTFDGEETQPEAVDRGLEPTNRRSAHQARAPPAAIEPAIPIFIHS